jgi:hypothetical protein
MAARGDEFAWIGFAANLLPSLVFPSLGVSSFCRRELRAIQSMATRLRILGVVFGSHRAKTY